MAHRCKRIIDGKTYNTETAARIFEKDQDPFFNEGPDTILYQTRFGAFFLHEYEERLFSESLDDITPLTHQEAQAWLETHAKKQPEIIEKLLGEMPEAGDTEAKFTLRLPQRLRDELAARAEENNQSLNAWMVRCLEGCAGRGNFE